MSKLSKTHKDHILSMIQNGDKLQWIKSYCVGAGFDVEDVKSPVYIQANKIALTYRNTTEYHIL